MNRLAFDIGTSFFWGADTFPKHPSEVGGLVAGIVKNLVLFSGVVFVILLVVGGFLMITGAGQGNQQKVGQGRQAATAAAAGFIIIFAAYWIAQIVQVITGVAFL